MALHRIPVIRLLGYKKFYGVLYLMEKLLTFLHRNLFPTQGKVGLKGSRSCRDFASEMFLRFLSMDVPHMLRRPPSLNLWIMGSMGSGPIFLASELIQWDIDVGRFSLSVYIEACDRHSCMLQRFLSTYSHMRDC